MVRVNLAQPMGLPPLPPHLCQNNVALFLTTLHYPDDRCKDCSLWNAANSSQHVHVEFTLGIVYAPGLLYSVFLFFIHFLLWYFGLIFMKLSSVSAAVCLYHHCTRLITYWLLLHLFLSSVLLNGPNPEGFSFVSSICFLYEIVFAVAECLLPEL